MDILDELKALTARLDQEGVDYALCGGLAMAVYDLPRATLDIDLLIQVESLFRAKRAVEPLGFTLSGEPIKILPPKRERPGRHCTPTEHHR